MTTNDETMRTGHLHAARAAVPDAGVVELVFLAHWLRNGTIASVLLPLLELEIRRRGQGGEA